MVSLTTALLQLHCRVRRWENLDK